MGGAGGGGGATAGSLGAGGNGGRDTGGTSGGGGGGGGLFGGGGGNGGPTSSPGFGGGGGSTGFASGVTGASSTLDTTGAPSVTLSFPADTAPPTVGFFVLSPTAFVAANSGPSAVTLALVGARVFYKLSEPAHVTFTVERPARGIKRAGSCVRRPKRPPRHAKPCTRYVAMRGSFAQDGVVGLNSLRFMGRLGGKSLPRGKYRLVASARDAAGNTSTRVRRPFRIVRG
jgi:hypothetical protein